MATNQQTADVDWALVERLQTGFFREYYRDEIGELAENYPTEKHLTIDWSDLFQFDPDVADDYLADPDTIDDHFQAALEEYDLPLPITLDDVDVRVVGLNDRDVYTPIGLTKAEDPGYVGVRGDIAKVTNPAEELKEACFECQRCGTPNYIPQKRQEAQEPHECQGCERQGPFEIIFDESTFRDYCKVRVQTPPDETGQIQGEHIDGYVRGDLVWHGHEEYGLVARSGDRATVYGTVKHEPTEKKSRLFEQYLDVDAIEFEDDGDDVDIQAHREAFEELAAGEDAVDVFAESIAPELYATPAWEAGLELLVAYLFAAPRISIDEGPTYRGDIHVLFMTDYGMGKSMVNEAIAKFSPKCIKESVTGMSSEVGLLAAAVKDDFSGETWTLQPGVLVRANGGHVILDEIDKSDVDLERMNDALEGEQIITVNKAGQTATYKSRTGLLATGNPAESRFDSHMAVSEQLDIDQSLLSRFDGIVTMQDVPDEDVDTKVAETQGMGYVEAQEYAYGDRDELDRLDRAVDLDVGRAWVAYAREHVHPQLSSAQVVRIKEWYAEARQANEKFAANEGEGADMPVPVTARVVPATMRFAVAFARVHLRETVAEADVERAIELSNALIGQTFNGRNFGAPETQGGTQFDRYEFIEETLRERGQIEESELLTECVGAGFSQSAAEHAIANMRRDGEIYEPENGVLEAT